MRSFVCKIILSGVLILSMGCGVSEIGIGEKGLRPCPSSPNCVISTGGDADHLIAPIPYLGDRETSGERIRRIVSGMDRARIITDRPDYLHVEIRSRVMKFVDDVEFWFPEKGKMIHVRSAARLGYSDFGVNRARIEQIRALYGKGDGSE